MNINKYIYTNSAIMAIAIGVILTVLFCILLFCRYENYIPLSYNTPIDANITASVGSLLGGVLAPLWSVITAYIYFSTMNIQAKELACSQEGIFAQNLNTLITRTIEVKNNLIVKGRNRKYQGNDGIDFLLLCVKYSYRILNKPNITPILNWEEYDKLQQQINMQPEDIQTEEYLIHIMARENYDSYKEYIKETEFTKYIPYFICLLQLSNNNLTCKKDSKSCIVEAFNVVKNKYKRKLNSYCIAIELCISYIYNHKSTEEEKKQYASWLTTIMYPSELVLFYYYLYSQKDEKQQIIKHCKELKFFKRIDSEQSLFDESHYNLYN